MLDLTFSMQEIEFFLLVFARVLSFVFIAPFFSMNNTPNRVKIGIGLFTAVLLNGIITDKNLPSYATVWGYGILVMKEVVTGLLIGFGANMCMNIVGFAGRVVDTEVGFAMASTIDPTTRQDTTITGMLYQYSVMLILIASGMYQYLLKALAETFMLIPVAGQKFDTTSLLQSMISFIRDFVSIGFRIALPVFISMTILNVILGVLAKVSPQMNMFAVGIQLKVLVGIIVLYFTMQMLPSVANIIYEEIRRITVSFVEGMM